MIAESMLKRKFEIYSEKYDIYGYVRDYGEIAELFFNYHDDWVALEINRKPLLDTPLEEVAKDVIESCIASMRVKVIGEEKKRKLQLHYWYVREHGKSEDQLFRLGHGIVTGHDRLPDSIEIHTSPIEDMCFDEEAGELILKTRNSLYHCPLEYCLFEKQDEYPDIIPDYHNFKTKYYGKIKYPSIEPGRILLVLANFCEYYFHSVYYVPIGEKDVKPLKYKGFTHVGTFQDSYLINVDGTKIDLRYFPHVGSIEFYMEQTNGCPWFMENIGDTVLYAKTQLGTIKLEPGERKEVSLKNVEIAVPKLPEGDLYPALFMD